MHYKGLKQAARQCLRDSRLGPCRLTLLFLLCDQAASFVTGVVIPIDGGFSAYSGV